jgi:DNA-binding transcriptional LysR family regulator
MARAPRHWDDRTARRLKLRDLRYLAAVAERGSMAQAAKDLGTSQPAVSKAISDLEHAIGVNLLDRNPQGAEPTIFGRALIGRVQAAIDELKQGVDEIEFLADPTVGEVRVGCVETVAAGFLPGVISRFARHHPRVRLVVEQTNSATLDYRELRERKLDLVINRIPEPFRDDTLNVDVLFPVKMFVIAGARSQWARRRKVRLADLVDEQWVRVPTRSPLTEVYAEAFAASGLELPPAAAETFSMHVVFHMVAKEGFVTLLPGFMLHLCKRLSIKALPIDLPIERRPMAVVTLKNRTLSPVVLRFIDCIHAVADPLAKGTHPGAKRAASKLNGRRTGR